jgi:hypothetical protein
VTTVKRTLSWDVTPCSLVEVYQRFEERTASIFRVEEYVEQASSAYCLLVAGSAYSSILKMEAVRFSETLVNSNPEDNTLQVTYVYSCSRVTTGVL